MLSLRLAPAILGAWLLPAAPAHAFIGTIWEYVSKYQIGFDWTSSYDGVNASYEMQRPDPNAVEYTDTCKPTDGDPTKQRCELQMQAGGSSGWGIFLQQAFKRQGQFYLNADIGFGARYLNGRMSEEDALRSQELGLPLKNMSFALGAVIVKPYVQFGITPASRWPDLLISLGPAAQIAYGKVNVNDQEEKVALATSSDLINGFFEVELVLWRYGDGALSVFTSTDVTGNEEGTKFYPEKRDGMDDFRANFRRSISGGVFGLGLKVLLNFP